MLDHRGHLLLGRCRIAQGKCRLTVHPGWLGPGRSCQKWLWLYNNSALTRIMAWGQLIKQVSMKDVREHAPPCPQTSLRTLQHRLVLMLMCQEHLQCQEEVVWERGVGEGLRRHPLHI